MKRQDFDILILIVVIVGYILHAGRIWLMNRHLRTKPVTNTNIDFNHKEQGYDW